MHLGDTIANALNSYQFDSVRVILASNDMLNLAVNNCHDNYLDTPTVNHKHS